MIVSQDQIVLQGNAKVATTQSKMELKRMSTAVVVNALLCVDLTKNVCSMKTALLVGAMQVLVYVRPCLHLVRVVTSRKTRKNHVLTVAGQLVPRSVSCVKMTKRAMLLLIVFLAFVQMVCAVILVEMDEKMLKKVQSIVGVKLPVVDAAKMV
jgi:hypothetical protein